MMFSDRIARLRKERGLNQKQLAAQLGVSVDSVRRWEQGKRSPDVDMLRNIARALNTTVSYISGETDDASPMQTNPPVVEISPSKGSSGSRFDLDDSAFMERLIKSNSMVVYDTGNERMLIPATSEGFKFIERMRAGHTSENMAMAR